MEEVIEASIFEEEISVVYGNFWERLGALILDGLILAPLAVLNYFNQSSWKSIPLMLAFGLVYIVYKPLLEFLYSATPGKKAISLTITNSSYSKINLKDAALRNIFGIVTGLASLVISFYTFDKNLLFSNKIQAGANMNDLMAGAITTLLYSTLVFFLYLADAICLLVNDRKQSLHDLIAKTYVIRK